MSVDTTSKTLLVAFKLADGSLIPLIEKDVVESPVWTQKMMEAAFSIPQVNPYSERQSHEDAASLWLLVVTVFFLIVSAGFIYFNTGYFFGEKPVAVQAVQPAVGTATDTVMAAREILKEMGIDVKKQDMSCFGG
jgi:hypothetical protein